MQKRMPITSGGHGRYLRMPSPDLRSIPVLGGISGGSTHLAVARRCTRSRASRRSHPCLSPNLTLIATTRAISGIKWMWPYGVRFKCSTWWSSRISIARARWGRARILVLCRPPVQPLGRHTILSSDLRRVISIAGWKIRSATCVHGLTASTVTFPAVLFLVIAELCLHLFCFCHYVFLSPRRPGRSGNVFISV